MKSREKFKDKHLKFFLRKSYDVSKSIDRLIYIECIIDK